MGKLLKYEIKGSYKNHLLVLIIALIVNIIGMVIGSRTTVFKPYFAFMILMYIVALTTILIFSISSFINELYEDRGYLTLSLPVKGSQIIWAKLINSQIWMLALSIIGSLPFLYVINQMTKSYFSISLKDYFNLKDILFVSVEGILSYFMLLITIYFSIIISKVALKDKKVGKFIAFVIFIAINMFSSMMQHLISKIIPSKIEIVKGLSQRIGTGTFSTEGINLNIGSSIFSIMMFIALFTLSSYMLDKKIDL